MRELPIGTVTFLFTDIEGSTRILEDLGENKYSKLLSAHSRIIRDSITRYDGVEVRTEGDAFFCVFQDAVSAINAVIAIQKSLTDYDWGPKGQIRVRMGLHTGQGITGEDDYLGIDVHRAARIAAAGHGGQVLLSAETYALTKRSLPADIEGRDMGEHRFKGLQESEHLFQLVIPELPVEFPALRSLAGVPNNIPDQLTSFFGRTAEKQLIQHKMDSARLVTLVGPGGTGKTRLAQEVAIARINNFASGVWLTELATISDPTLVPQTIAASLGLREQPGIALPISIANHIGQNSLLLILDNCEHLLNAVSSLIDHILKECPNLKILATSRQLLGVRGESICQIPGLSVPDFDSAQNLDELMDHESVMLFYDRATLRNPDFKITAANAPYLIQICRRLDGMPLAIELAASRANVLNLQQIAERLDDRFQLLTQDAGGALSKNQTLRLTMDWSYDLLSEQEAMLLKALSVFAGGFDLDAVETVCGGGQDAPSEILDLLQRLIEKSLVYLDSSHQAARYQLLETVREYAKDKASMSKESAIFGLRHAEFFLKMVKDSDPEIRGSGHSETQAAALNRLDVNHDNLRTALHYLTGENAGIELAGALWRFWEIRGYLSEGRESLRRVMRNSNDLSPGHRARALDGAGRLASRQGDFEQSGPHFQESLALWRSIGNREGEGNALNGLARAAVNLGDYPTAQKWVEQSLEIQQEIWNSGGIANDFNTLGEIARSQGDFKRAESWYTKTLSLFRDVGDTAATVTSLHNLGYSNLNQGNTANAGSLFFEALTIARNLNDQLGIFSMLGGLAAVAVEQGNVERGVELFGAAEVVGRTHGYAGDRIDQTEVAHRVEIAKQKLGMDSFDHAWNKGGKMSYDQAIKFALGESE